MTLCFCGCGLEVREGNRFIRGHFNRGKILSIEQKEKISKSCKGKNKGKKYPQLSGDLNPAKRPEVRVKISKNRKGKYCGEINHNKTPEARRKRSIYMMGDNNPAKRPEVREKISKVLTGRIISEEWKNKRVKTIKKNGCYIGNKNPNWRGGLSFEPYCHKFNEKLKNKIRERDNYQCQHPDCLTTQLESLILYNRRLLIHHIHYDKPNCEPDLITLCLKHNCLVNFNRESHEKLFMEILKKRNLLN